jgi:hypothetical protein
VVNRLTMDGDFDKGISVRLLLKNWPGAFKEWPVKSVRDAMYASPQFPRIIRGSAAIQDTIAKGVSAGELAYVGKTTDGKYSPFLFRESLSPEDVEISEDVFLITKSEADAYVTANTAPVTPKPPVVAPDPDTEDETDPVPLPVDDPPTDGTKVVKPVQPELFPHIEWTGEIPAQKWMNFYTKVVSKFAAGKGVKLKVSFEASPEGGVSRQKLEETRAALRELGLDGDVNV